LDKGSGELKVTKGRGSLGLLFFFDSGHRWRTVGAAGYGRCGCGSVFGIKGWMRGLQEIWHYKETACGKMYVGRYWGIESALSKGSTKATLQQQRQLKNLHRCPSSGSSESGDSKKSLRRGGPEFNCWAWG
jgi:hypothetical protein